MSYLYTSFPIFIEIGLTKLSGQALNLLSPAWKPQSPKGQACNVGCCCNFLQTQITGKHHTFTNYIAFHSCYDTSNMICFSISIHTNLQNRLPIGVIAWSLVWLKYKLYFPNCSNPMSVSTELPSWYTSLCIWVDVEEMSIIFHSFTGFNTRYFHVFKWNWRS